MRASPAPCSLHRFPFALASLIVLGFPIIALAQTVPEDFVERGLAKYAKGDLDGAIADYSRAIEIDSKNAEAYRNRGRARFFKKDNDGAIEDFTRLIEFDPKQAFGWHARGLAKSAKHDFDDAIADYTQALKLDPNDRACYLNRGMDKMNKGDFDGALADCTRALEVDPKYCFAYTGRGAVKMNNGDLEGALADFNHALEIDPKFDQGYASRGRVYLAQRNWNAALADFRHGGDLDQTDQDYAAIDLWLIHMHLGDSDDAGKGLSAYFAERKDGKPDDWESTVAGFLLGKATEADLLAAAAAADAKGGGDLTESGHRCEAWYYAGMKRVFGGDKSAAIDDFTKCLAIGKKVFFEYQFAQSELKALGKLK